MNMYVWESEALKNYTNGSIVVLAEDPDSARSLVWRHFHNWARNRYDYMFFSNGDLDENLFREDYNRIMSQFSTDLEKEPTVQTVLFIQGSN